MSKGFKSFFKDNDGSTAIEFALVSIPFIMLLIAVIEISLMFTASSTLQAATQEAARLIRTGQVQQSGTDPEEMFREALCEFSTVFVPCNQIQYEVISMDGGFSDYADYQPEYDDDGNLESQGFTPGGVNDVVLVRAVYRYPLITPMVGPLFADGPNNTRLMVATVVMENEPYDIREVQGEM